MPIQDSSQRQQAIDPAGSFIVQAPAGSGKTGLLIQRYLRLLATVDNPEEIIAITFTRKAAAEMQGRVLASIADAAEGRHAESDYEHETLDLARAALDQNRKKDWRLPENPGRLRIQTIDAWCATLVRQMPLLSRLGGMQEVMDDAMPAYEQAADATLLELESKQDWGEAVTRLLEHLDNDLPRLKALLIDMLQKRDQWLRYVLSGYERDHLVTALENLLQEKLARVEALIPEEHTAEICHLLRFAADNLATEKPDSPICVCKGIESLPGTSPGDLEQWVGVAELLVTAGGTWRISLNKNMGFPPGTDDQKEQMKALVNQLGRVDGLEQAVADIRMLPPAAVGEYEWEIVAALAELLKLAALQLQVYFNEHNRQDFIGIAQSALTALGPEDDPTDLAMYLDYQVKHVLVDEFQDVSVNQYDLLARLTGGWTGDDGRSLFLVGDPMQSIYRFREAEVGNFIHTFHHERLGTVPLTPLVLSSNFRSDTAIVDWINGTFERVLAEQDDLTTGAVSFHPSTATINSDGNEKVHVHTLYDDSGEAEADQIVQLIQTLNSSFRGRLEGGTRYPLSPLGEGRVGEQSASVVNNSTKGDVPEIAILVRTRNHLLQIIPGLREANIPFQAVDIELLGEKPCIQDILALTRAWLYPADRIAWLSVLRAPWCGIDLENLLVIAGDGDELIEQRIRNAKIIDACDAFTQARLQRLVDIFDDVKGERHRIPVRKLIETLWTRLGGPATLRDESELEDCAVLFDLLDELDRGNDINDLDILIDRVTQLFGRAGRADPRTAVQVMTMHKAKGLEFDNVILPGLGRTPRYSSTELMKWMLRPTEDGGHDLLIGAIRQTGEEHAPIYKYIQAVERQKDHYETQRLLYVATTRAKQSLHLFGSAMRKQGRGGEWECSISQRSLLGHLWPVVKDQYEEALQPPVMADTGEAQAIDQSNRRLKKGWKLPAVPGTRTMARPIEVLDTEQIREPIEYEWAGETIKRVGTVVHRCIQWMAKEGLSNWNENRVESVQPRIKTLLIQSGIDHENIAWSQGQVISALKNMLQDERGRWILAEDHAEQHNELSLTGMYDNQLIIAVIDRTFIDRDGTRWIVDYKSSRHEGPDLDAFLDQEQERYAGQLQKYGRLMQALDDRPVRLGLYFPLLKGWREWACAD